MPTKKDREKITASRRRAVLRCLEDNSTISEAMAAIDMPRARFYEWVEADPVFAEACRIARLKQAEEIEQRLQAILRDGITETEESDAPNGTTIKTVHKRYPSTMLRYLERRHRDYKPTQTIDGIGLSISVPTAGELDVSPLNAAERRELERLLRKCGADSQISTA